MENFPGHYFAEKGPQKIHLKNLVKDGNKKLKIYERLRKARKLNIKTDQFVKI